MIYFCQGCSAVFTQRKKYCPHCGEKQYYVYSCENCGLEIEDDTIDECPECYESIYRDEDKERSCPYCGYNLDSGGRNLNLKYCNGTDCGKEIGGLIRYSEETGEELSIDEIMVINDFNKEIKDWLSYLYGGTSCFHRYLYIYDKSGTYSSAIFLDTYTKIFTDFEFHKFAFSEFPNDNILKNLVVENKYAYGNKPKLCVVDIPNYKDYTASHYLFFHVLDYWYYDSEHDYQDIARKLNTEFIFISDVLPEKTKIGTHLDKHFLIISPEVLKTVDISTLVRETSEVK